MSGNVIGAGRTLILGTGYVAGAYARALHSLGLRPFVLSRDWLDYTNPSELRYFMHIHGPQLVINAAGFTGNTVDDCQRNLDACRRANMELPGVIAEICQEGGAAMIHVSSGCIFDGQGPFDEEAAPNFCDNVYQRTKLFGEQRVSTACDRAWIFRIRMPFGPRWHRRNWLCKLTGYDRILDGHNSVTFIDEFAMRSYQLVQKADPGIYHAACPHPVYTAQVARMLFDAGLRKRAVELFKHADFIGSGHVQRSAAVLDVSKFEKAYGSAFGDPVVSLRWCIDNLRSSHATSPQ